jgi:histidinol dehydrogenase
MIKILDSNNNNFNHLLNNLLSKRRSKMLFDTRGVVQIIKDVKKNGDKAILKYEKKFGKNSVIVPNRKNIKKAILTLDPKIKKAIDLAYTRIYKFHSMQKFKDILYIDKLKNKLEYKYKSIDSVGIYVPGSNVSYPSSVLMNAVPALIAGVKRIVMINPGKNGKQNPAVLYAAKKCKISEIYSIGGPAAIAAITYGTKKIKKVSKIVGPGSIQVAAAKKEVFGDIGIEGMVAGPSEVTIVCDKFSNPDWIASDLIGQAEHDKLSQCILISKNKKFIYKVQSSIKYQLKELPRALIAKKSLLNYGAFIHMNSDKKIIETINKISPEHLELNIKGYKNIVNKVSAGSISLGKYAVTAMTDYHVGVNHTLPTNSSAKYASGLSVSDFIKRISVVTLSKKGIEKLGPSVICLSDYEELYGHSKSVKLRINN